MMVMIMMMFVFMVMVVMMMMVMMVVMLMIMLVVVMMLLLLMIRSHQLLQQIIFSFHGPCYSLSVNIIPGSRDNSRFGIKLLNKVITELNLI